ncbi:MAG: hypothetical protein LBG13_03695 [Holosporales bacterium]|jgi:glyoxylase-like metal-dependent hydrolase (beta-lactamase superfamily II)|nr:hypothetical protein [Holosporales bacterium]
MCFFICFPIFAIPSQFGMRVFNVGSANFVLLSSQDSLGVTRHLVVDAGFDRQKPSLGQVNSRCGYTVSSSDEVLQEVISTIGMSNFSVIISHLDEDHWNLLEELKKANLQANKVVIGSNSKVALSEGITGLSNTVLEIQNKVDGTVVFSKTMGLSHTSAPAQATSSFDVAQSLENCLGIGVSGK